MLQHQQNMLQDFVRTGTYYAAILDNRIDFEGQAVCDVGAGSGILSLFAAQAGARVVYAVEASGMAQYASQLAAANAGTTPIAVTLHRMHGPNTATRHGRRGASGARQGGGGDASGKGGRPSQRAHGDAAGQ